MSIIYGPVLSRRFGYSLGIDIVPYKICTYDCIYCQLGKTTNKTVERKRYISIDLAELIEGLKKAIKDNKRIDYITFSGAGEPTLNQDIGILINKVKEATDIPVVVLTGGGILYKESVRDDIKKADIIKVSFDAPNDKILRKVNRPSHEIDFAKNIEGLKKMLKVFEGKIWLEIMLIKGINDDISVAEEFKKIIDEIDDIGTGIEKIHLNTAVRPTGSKDVSIPDLERLNKIKTILGRKAELIKYKEIKVSGSGRKNLSNDIIELSKRRPVSIKDINESLKVNINEVIKCLRELLIEGKLKYKIYNSTKYYYV
jgi:wyosine [tRNA(Phe)-imidazoG37] synthetase (radical SAM superfamily)